MSVEETLKERGSVHGDFTMNAAVARELKNVVAKWDIRLTSVQREGLDAIMCKVARILAGDPSFKDHWHDIQGYARLVEERL